MPWQGPGTWSTASVFRLPAPARGNPTLGGALLAAGSALLLVLLCLNPFLKDLFAPLSLSFVPVILMALGLAARPETTGRTVPGIGSLLKVLVISLAMLPLVCDVIFLSMNGHLMQPGELTPWLFHRVIITVVSLFIAGVFACLSFRKAEKRTDALLFSILCLLVCAVNFRDIIVAGFPGGLPMGIVPVNDMFLAGAIGICAHLALKVARKADPVKIWLAYAAGLSIVPVMIYESYLGGSLLVYEPLRIRDLGHVLFIVIFASLLLRCGLLLAAEARSEKDQVRKKGILSILLGLALTLAVLLVGSAIGSFSLYSYAFIALLLVGYGVFVKDLLRMNTHARRQALSNLLRLLLTAVYISLGLGVAWILRDFTPQLIMDSIVPYGIPPLLSFIVAATLSLFVLGIEKNRPEGHLFCLVSFCYAMLNLDIALVGIVRDPETALFISRADHFFLSLLMLGVNLHLAYLVIGKKDAWWVVYASYLIGLIMAPLSQTPYYFQGMHSYYWGLFARKAVLYDLMSALWMAGTVYSIFLLSRAYMAAEASRKCTIMRVLIGFMSMALLSLSNTPAIYGYEIYPFGTFIFVALFYLAYALFRFNLRMALQNIRSILFAAGLAGIVLVIGFVPVYLLPGIGVNARVLAGLLLVSVLYHPARKGFNAVLDLFIRKSSDVMKESYYQLTSGLTRLNHREKIHQMLSTWVFEVLEGSCFVSLYSVNDLSGQKIYFGWKTWNARNETGLFGDRANIVRDRTQLNLGRDHPLIEACGYEQAICTRDALLKVNPSLNAFDGHDGLLRDTEVVVPVFSRGQLLALILIGKKADGSPYSRGEFDTLHNISLVLGPQIENAVLMEGLEEKVALRTRELNSALNLSRQREKEIRENSEIITRQNQIFRTLLETSTRIHHLESIDDLFTFILSQLHTLFTDFSGGIILENKRRGILEATSFIGISEDEQRVILSMRHAIGDPDFGKMLNSAFVREGITTSADDVWNVLPMEARSSKIVGHMIFKGQVMDRQTREIFTVFLGQLSAVTQNKILMIQLERMASTDGMTGLYNRAYLNQELRKVVQHAKRFRNIFFSIMVVDVNGLKRLNDTYGHEKGDEAIVKVAGLLKSMCRATDIVCRLGGDEFAILMPSTAYHQAETLYKRIIEAAQSLRITVTQASRQPLILPVDISVGLASSDDTPPEDVMKKADTIMYEAKETYYTDRKMSRG